MTRHHTRDHQCYLQFVNERQAQTKRSDQRSLVRYQLTAVEAANMAAKIARRSVFSVTAVLNSWSRRVSNLWVLLIIIESKGMITPNKCFQDFAKGNKGEFCEIVQQHILACVCLFVRDSGKFVQALSSIRYFGLVFTHKRLRSFVFKKDKIEIVYPNLPRLFDRNKRSAVDRQS